MKKIVFILLAICMTGTACEKKGVVLCNCEGKEVKYVLKDEPAYIIKGCFEYSSRMDSFSIVLENYPQGISTIFPCAEIPKQYRKDNFKVLVSGNILDYGEFNGCWAAPNVRILPTHIFELTNIKKN